MILPGIFGSTMLLILGLYIPLITAVSAFIHLSVFPALLIFGLGVIAGHVVFTKIVRWYFKKFRLQTIYCLLRRLIGSFYAIIRGPTTIAEPLPALNLETSSLLFFIIGIPLLFILQLIKKYVAGKTEKQQPQT